jgi:hypothetical protein
MDAETILCRAEARLTELAATGSPVPRGPQRGLN